VLLLEPCFHHSDKRNRERSGSVEELPSNSELVINKSGAALNRIELKLLSKYACVDIKSNNRHMTSFDYVLFVNKNVRDKIWLKMVTLNSVNFKCLCIEMS